MTDLLPRTVEDRIVPTPPHPMPAVRAPHRGYGQCPPRPRVASAARVAGPKRGRWSAVIILAVMDWMLAMFLIGNALFPDTLPVGVGSAPTSTVPSPVVGPPATGGGDPVAAHAQGDGRPRGPDGGAPTQGATSTTVSEPVVHDAAPTRGQTPGQRGPAGGPASTTTTKPTPATTTTSVAPVAPTLPPTPPMTITGPAPTPTTTEGAPVPEDPPPSTEPLP